MLLLLKQSESSVKIHRCGQFGGVVTYIIRSAMKNIVSSTVTIGFCILTDDSYCFSNSNFSKAPVARSLMMVIKPKHVGAFLM